MGAPGTQLNLTNGIRGPGEIISVNTGTAGDAVQVSVGFGKLTIAHLGLQNNDTDPASCTPSVTGDAVLIFDAASNQVAPSFNLDVTTNTTGAANQGRKLVVFPNGSADIRGADLAGNGYQNRTIGLLALNHGCYVQLLPENQFGF